jgi:5-deoxy-D-glucuronate isomerase
MPEVPKNQMLRSSPSGPPSALVAAGTRLDKFSTLQKDAYYIKQGRTANVTGAMYNRVVAVCNWKTRYESYDSNANTI